MTRYLHGSFEWRLYCEELGMIGYVNGVLDGEPLMYPCIVRSVLEEWSKWYDHTFYTVDGKEIK